MPRLTWHGRRRDGEPADSGAIAAMVALLLTSGLLLGLGALVIDVGLISDESEQLQSAADAGSWAVAENCVADPYSCDSRAGELAGRYAAANVRDHRAGVSAVICRNDCGPRPAPCPAPASNVYAEVHTTTENADGSTLLPPRFAAALSGAHSDGTAVAACAQVSWGLPSELTVFGLAVSACDVEASGGNWYTVPDLDPRTRQDSGAIAVPDLPDPGPDAEQTIGENVGGDPLCPSLRGPAGAVWLAGADADCRVDATLSAMQTATAPPGCVDALALAQANHRPVLVGVYDEVIAATDYVIVGFAALVVTGYDNVRGTSADSWLTGTRPACPTAPAGEVVDETPAPAESGTPAPADSASTDEDYGELPPPGAGACYFGYFTKMTAPRTPPVFGTGADYGVTVIGRVG